MVIDLRPICDKGQRVKAGDILTEGYATENGELALGRNLLVAYMPWKGYNYEDAIVLSERMVREDILTSVHVDEYSVEVRRSEASRSSQVTFLMSARKLLKTLTRMVSSVLELLSFQVIYLLVRYLLRVKATHLLKRSCSVQYLVTRQVM